LTLNLKSKVINEQHVVADTEPGLHAVGNRAGRDRVFEQALWDRGFLIPLFQQGRFDPMPIADPAGDEVVELVRRHLLARRPPADPQA